MFDRRSLEYDYEIPFQSPKHGGYIQQPNSRDIAHDTFSGNYTDFL